MKLEIGRTYKYFLFIITLVPIQYIIGLAGHSIYFDHREPIFPILLILFIIPSIVHFLLLPKVRFEDNSLMITRLSITKQYPFSDIISIHEKRKKALFGLYTGYQLTINTGDKNLKLNSIFHNNYIPWMLRFYEKTKHQFRSKREQYTLEKNRKIDAHWEGIIAFLVFINACLFFFKSFEAMVNIVVHQKLFSLLF